jgi:hypothetical protein
MHNEENVAQLSVRQKRNMNAAAAIQQPPSERPAAVPVLTARPDMSPDQRRLQLVAVRLQRAYNRTYGEWASMLSTVDTDYASSVPIEIWVKIAKHMESIGCDSPERFITAQFRSGLSKPPRQLCTSSSIRLYREYMVDQPLRYARTWNGDVQTFEVETSMYRHGPNNMTEPQICEFVIGNPRIYFCPLFRYCVAYSLMYLRIIELYQRMARDVVLRDPAGYYEQLGAKIPDVLRRAVQNELAEEVRKDYSWI